jgi:hypothetical protein
MKPFKFGVEYQFGIKLKTMKNVILLSLLIAGFAACAEKSVPSDPESHS